MIDTHIGVVGGSLIRRFPMLRIGLVFVLYSCTSGRENCHQDICNIGPMMMIGELVTLSEKSRTGFKVFTLPSHQQILS